MVALLAFLGNAVSQGQEQAALYMSMFGRPITLLGLAALLGVVSAGIAHHAAVRHIEYFVGDYEGAEHPAKTRLIANNWRRLAIFAWVTGLAVFTWAIGDAKCLQIAMKKLE